MTREEAVAYWTTRSEHIHEWLKENEDVEFIGEYVEAIDMAIEALSAEAAQGWIPCSERLPSESGWYLITVQGCEKVADMEWYYSEWDAWNGVSLEQQVIAWMPLPTPYKGGDDE